MTKHLLGAVCAAIFLGWPAVGRSQLVAPLQPPRGLAPPPRWSFYPGLTLGYDTFGQRYVIDEADTLDLVNELAARLVTAIEHRGTVRFGIKNTFGLGQQATRDDIWAHLEIGRAPLELRFEQELHYKAYAPGADYSESSDYWSGIGRAQLRARMGPRWKVRLEDRFEWARYEEPSPFSWNYGLNDVLAFVDREYALFSRLSLGYGFGSRSVPDSTEIGYHRHVARVDWEHELGNHDLQIEQRIERRLYGDPRVRSDYVDWTGRFAGRADLHPKLRLRPEYAAQVVGYDIPDSIYSDYSEQAAELLLEGDAGRSTILALGPRAEFRRTQDSFDRPYNQWGLKGSVTYTMDTRLWLQFTNEVGTRQHLAGDNLFFTDYLFNWSTLYLAWNPLPRLGFDLFFALNPELHEHREDDSTLILISTSLTYGWR